MFIRVKDYNDGFALLYLNTDNIVSIKEGYDNRFNTGGPIYFIETNSAVPSGPNVKPIIIDRNDAAVLFQAIGIQ